MEKFKFARNLIVAVLGLFVAFFILNIVKEDTDTQISAINTSSTTPTTNTPIGLTLTSEKGISIFVTSLKTDLLSSSPMKISGRAPGNWFFEANMPVTLTNWDGLIIAQGHVNASGDWMTTDYVPFEGQIEFTQPDYGEKGYLILHKDNPSGESQFDDSVEMTVKLN